MIGFGDDRFCAVNLGDLFDSLRERMDENGRLIDGGTEVELTIEETTERLSMKEIADRFYEAHSQGDEDLIHDALMELASDLDGDPERWEEMFDTLNRTYAFSIREVMELAYLIGYAGGVRDFSS